MISMAKIVNPRNWKVKVQLEDPLEGYQKELANMLLQIDSMWDALLGLISDSTLRVKITARSVHQVYCSLYQAGLKTGAFKRVKFEKVLVMNGIELTQTESAALIVFGPEKHGSLGFHVYYRKPSV